MDTPIVDSAVHWHGGILAFTQGGLEMLLFYLSLLKSQEDQDKFEQLYRKYAKLMKYVALQKLKNEQLAEEAVHESFIKVINSFYKIEEVDSHKTKRFLVIVTENTAIDILRKEKPDQHVSYDNLEWKVSASLDGLDHMAVGELVDIIANMPELYRTVLELRAYHGLNDKQIAIALNISQSAARKRLERARMKLAEELTGQQKGEVYESV